MKPRGEAEAVLYKRLDKDYSSYRCTNGGTLVMMLLFCCVFFASAQICIALPVHLLRQVFFKCFFCSFFNVVFHDLFEVLLVASWTVFGPYVGPMLGAFSSFFRS